MARDFFAFLTRIRYVFALLFLLSTFAVFAQITLQAPPPSGSTLPPITFTTLIKGKPYDATKFTHTRKVLADGTVTTHDTQMREARDSDGRVIAELQTEIPEGRAGSPIVVLVMNDITNHTQLTWNNRTKFATQRSLPSTPVSASAGPLMRPVTPPPTPELLGKRMIHGLMTTGRRTEKTIPAGTMGNAAPTVSKREWWTDDDLGLLVQETETDPIRGERTTELVDLKLGEPDPARFHPPAGYIIHELPSPATHSPAALAGLPPDVQRKLPLDLEHVPSMSHNDAVQKLSSKDIQEKRIGAAFLVNEAQATKDDVVEDDVAYLLVRKNIGLREAEQLSEAAVHSAEAASSDSSSAKSSHDAFANEMALGRYWHTLGYINFLLGNIATARVYLESAWHLDPQSSYGEHLGKVLEVAGDKQEALRVDRQTLASTSDGDLQRKLHLSIDTLAGPEAAAVLDPKETPLVGAAAQDGDAFFDLVYSAGRDHPDIVFTVGTDALRSLAPLVTQTEAKSFTLPDKGPETVVRRVHVLCKSGPDAGCQLQDLTAHNVHRVMLENWNRLLQ